MSQSRYVALLRGINVGGKNLIAMADLRGSFEDLGFTEVATYIQSGNVVFSSKKRTQAKLAGTIEKALSRAFRYDSRVVVLSAVELERVVAQAPGGFGRDLRRYRYDVLFVKAPLSTREALEQVAVKPGVDEAHAGDHALYFRRLVRKAAQSHLTKLIQRPAYRNITIRNWRTTTKLLQMVSADSSGEEAG